MISEIISLNNPRKIKKEKRDKKERKAKVAKPESMGTKARKPSAPRVPLALRNPLVENNLGQTEYFGSISDDEERNKEDLLSSLKAGPVNLHDLEPIEIDSDEMELHPSQAEQLISDADRIIFGKD